MNSSRFGNCPFSDENIIVYPKEKGILLFYKNGDVRDIYGREHAIMLQDIGYWYTDNIQAFLLNYSYNGVVAIIFESGTSLVYLPKYISEKQQNMIKSYFEENVSDDNKKYLEFYVMRCLEDANNDEFIEIERNKRGLIKNVKGKDITGNKFFSYYELEDYLKTVCLNNNKLKK